MKANNLDSASDIVCASVSPDNRHLEQSKEDKVNAHSDNGLSVGRQKDLTGKRGRYLVPVGVSSAMHTMTMITACQTDTRPRVYCIGLHDMPNIALPSIITTSCRRVTALSASALSSIRQDQSICIMLMCTQRKV